MSKITVELEADEAMFVVAACDTATSTAWQRAAKMRALGIEESFELDVQETAATKTDAARRKIADAIWPLSWDEVRAQDRRDEAELGIA